MSSSGFATGCRPVCGARLSPSQSIMMRITIERQPLEQIETGALIVLVFEGRKEARFGAGDLVDAGEVAGKSLELTLLHRPPGVAATRVLLAGAGKPEKFDSAELRKVAGAAVRHLKSKSVKRIAFVLESGHANPEFAAAAVEGAILGDYEPDRHKTGNDKKQVDALILAVSGE